MCVESATKREKRHMFFAVVAVGLGALLIGAPVVEAAISRVKLAGGTAFSKIEDSEGGAIASAPIAPMGLLQAKGSKGALAVSTYPGGGGLLGAGDCTASTEPAQGPLKNTVRVSGDAIITGVLVTGTGTVRLTSAALPNIPLANIAVNAQNPAQFLALSNGVSAPSEITFTGIDGTACNFMVFGLGVGDDPTAP